MSYPIPVDRFEGEQGMTIVCEKCHAEAVITPDEIQVEGLFPCPGKCAEWSGVFKFWETPRCRGCREFATDFLVFEQNDGCCSRVCRLQADYIAGWKAIRTVAV